ncbi:hypothetical protein PLICRDRAFT_178686 [Plicaturopsis crispa FD-325 SS-3]|nr:hypothetical protein PLICRDRAFT_178686 [Plicaturopsis crispa FD-325 SS-3]
MNHIVLSALGFLSLSAAQDLGVPTGWREFSNSRPLSERISIGQDAINTINGQLGSTGQFNGIGYWQSGNVWSVAANQDHVAGTTVNKDATTNALNAVFAAYANYDQYGVSAAYNDDAMWWATAAVYANRAYSDGTLLAHAEATWDHVTGYVITADEASSGSQPNKGFTIASTCDGATMAGGVFWRPTSDDTSVNSITTGLYVALSAYLAEVTGDSKYTNAAILSATWIKAHNLNSDYLVLDTVNAQDCSKSPATELFTYNSGKYVEGLSVLAAVTGDSQWTDLLVNIVAASVKSTVWEGANGIITEGSDTTANNDGVGFKAVFIRGLHEAYNRSSNSDLRTLIHSYIDVQYNALLELAANGSSYSANWSGPAQAFTTWGQLAALDVLTSAIDTN